MTFSSSQNGNKKIKVLHLITSLEVGGAQHGLLLGLPRFNPEKYEHIVCSLMDRMQMAEQFRQSGIEVHSLRINRKADLSGALRLHSLLKRVRVDILHTYLLHSNIIGRIIGRLVGVPTIIGSERTIGQAGKWDRILTKLTNPLTDAVEVNSQAGADAINQYLGVPKEKIELVRSGLDLKAYSTTSARPEMRADLNLNQDQHLVLYIGRLRPVKGVEYGLRAFAIASSSYPNLHMALAGEGEQRGYLQKLVADLDISHRVTFLGIRKDLPNLLAASDSVLMPSITEGFPRTAIEAMAAGKPVIATDVGGTSEAIINGSTGILVPPKDVNAMAKALGELIADINLQTRLGKAGMQRAQQGYPIENYVKRLDGLYSRLCGFDKPHDDIGSIQDSVS